jgi:hypothetical protein
MSEIVIHTINYTVDELMSLAKSKEIFRKYPKNPDHAYLNFRDFLLDPECQNIDIEVSNLGYIRIDGKTVEPYEKGKGYFYIKIKNNIEYLVYRLVAETWLECPFEDSLDWQVHHIVNEGNDVPENLIWIKKCLHDTIH